MEVNVKTQGDVTIVDLAGDIDSKTAASVQDQILPLAGTAEKILLNLTQVPYMSSAGLRILLSVYRQVTAKNSKLILVGVNEEIKDTMSVTGFLDFFKIHDTIEAGIEALK